jgi:hypothetical protein
MLSADEIAAGLVAGLLKHAKIVAEEHGWNLSMETPAVELLTEHALRLGPDGLVDVMGDLMDETEETEQPIARTQTRAAVDRYFSVNRGFNN